METVELEPARDAGSDEGDGASSARVRIGILTISDRASRGEMEDQSGPAIQKALSKSKFVIAVYACIADDRKQITRTLRRWADEDLCDCILTTGGTGLSERDVTPEATARAIDRELPHLATHLALQGAKTVPTAVISRGMAGARGRTLIVNLPGSPDGAAGGGRILSAIVPHAVSILRGGGHGPVTRVDESDSGNGHHA
jgi:molybdenum cofactor synthesis domain-containing protein